MSDGQWRLTSASVRFKNCKLLFDITQFFKIGYIGEVCSNLGLNHLNPHMIFLTFTGIAWRLHQLSIKVILLVNTKISRINGN